LKLRHWDGGPFDGRRDQNRKGQMEKALESAFSGFPQKPRFRCVRKASICMIAGGAITDPFHKVKYKVI